MPPWGIVGLIVFSLCPFPDESTYVYRIWCQSVHPFGSFPRLKFVTPYTTPPPPKCPLWYWGRIVFNYVQSQTNPQTCTKFGANWLGRLTASQDIWICDPLKPPTMPPGGIVGRLVFSPCPFLDESADVNQSWCQSVQPFDSFSSLLNVWPPKTPSVPPCVSKGNLFGVYPFPDESTHVCQIWCQSVQPFDSFNILEFVTP